MRPFAKRHVAGSETEAGVYPSILGPNLQSILPRFATLALHHYLKSEVFPFVGGGRERQSVACRVRHVALGTPNATE